jgi:hypothetical protein
MKFYLSLDVKSHNKLAAEIADTIKECFPIGIKTMEPEYNNHPGIKKLDEMVADQMTHYKSFISPWMLFLTKLKKDIKKRISNTTFAHQWAYSAELIIEKHNDKSLEHIKKLVFAVSSIGPYFSICGIDTTSIKDSQGGGLYSAINVITVSPYAEFEDLFNYLKNEIELQFPTHKFIPFSLCTKYLKDIDFGTHEECLVYYALFNSNVFDKYIPHNLRGDSFYE